MKHLKLLMKKIKPVIDSPSRKEFSGEYGSPGNLASSPVASDLDANVSDP